MDLSKDVIYRGEHINFTMPEPGRVLRGIQIETADYSDINTTAYTEKRAGSDGMHASDIYLGGRAVNVSGHIYATNPAQMFDYLHTIRSIFSPTSAYQESPGAKGFLPMRFSQPTEDVESWPLVAYPDGIPMYMNLRPMAPPRFTIVRDRQSRNGAGPTAVPWQARLMAKDPRMYVAADKDALSGPSQTVPLDGTGSAATPKVTAGDAINRGDYETPLDILLAIGNTVPVAGSTFKITVGFGVVMTITLSAGKNIVYRWFGDDRVLMTQDVTTPTAPGPLILRMDLVTFATLNRKPMVPADINPPNRPYKTAYSCTCNTTLATGSRLFWSEAFA